MKGFYRQHSAEIDVGFCKSTRSSAKLSIKRLRSRGINLNLIDYTSTAKPSRCRSWPHLFLALPLRLPFTIPIRTRIWQLGA